MKTLRASGLTAGVLCLMAGCVAPGTTDNQTAAPAAPAAPAAQTPAKMEQADAPQTPQPQAARVVERPSNAVGDVCYYDRTIGYKKMRETRTLTSMTTDKLVWEIQTDTGIKGVLEANIVDNGFVVFRDVSWANGQIVTAASGYRWISFPAAPGQNWGVKTDFKGETFTGTIEDEINYDKWEKVKVPAGEFNSLRLNIKSAYWNLPRKGTNPDVKGNMTIWVSPDTKCLITELKFSNSVGEKGSARLVASN